MVRERIEELRRQLELHNFKYYVENAPEISDFEFDAMMRDTPTPTRLRCAWEAT